MCGPMMNLDIYSPDVNTLLTRFSTRRDCCKSIPIGPRSVGAELVGNIQLRAPVLAPRSGGSHDGFDSEGVERLCNFFHLSGAAFTVKNYTAHHITCKALPVDSRKAFV